MITRIYTIYGHRGPQGRVLDFATNHFSGGTSCKIPELTSKLTSNSYIFNRFEILSVILILIIRHLPHPELKVALFVEFAIQTLALIPEVIYICIAKERKSLQRVMTFL